MTIDIPQKLYRLILVVAFGFAVGVGLTFVPSSAGGHQPIIGPEVHGGEVQIIRDENARLRIQVVDLRGRVATLEAEK